MSLGPQGGRSLLAAMWRLAISRQQLLLVALVLVLIDGSAVAAVIGALGKAHTFSSFSSAIFDESRTLADALDRAVGGNGACAAAVALYVVARPWPMAWIRASYIRALASTGGFPRPTWPSVVRLVLLDVCVGTPLGFGIGMLEKADLPEIGPPVLLVVLMFTLYADYAIVIDDLTLRQAFRSSLHVLMRRPGASLGVTAVWLTFSFVLAAALGPSFDSGATPLTLTALLVFTGVLGFGLDVCLITLYRATPPPPQPGEDF
ncbi:MAG: hypothetical protein QOE87_2539 [Gaiellales bacterium]|nr:hypothetical protein [Gaiellales bacterium]